MSALMEFLARFERVKSTGGQHLVCCPAHPDRTPSLAVKEGDGGAVLLKCHAGCTTDSILAAMGLEPAALFEPTNGNGSHAVPVKREIVATYDYKNEQGHTLFQAVRYNPKGFSQRAPTEKGKWAYTLNGVRRVVYRLPELKGCPAILICEGEKDVDRAWDLGLPATCNPMGAGKWEAEYSKQLVAQGVQRVAILPDHDPVGAQHAEQVATACHAAGLKVRVVELPGLPDHGDLSDYLNAGHTKDELLALVRDCPAWTAKPAAPDKHFEQVGDQHYRMTLKSGGIVLDLDRLRRDRDGMTGELQVSVTGLFPAAKHFRGGIINIGDLNLSSTQARSTRAKLLAERSGDKGLDWYGLLEEFVTEVMAKERDGDPSVGLCDVPLSAPIQEQTWVVEGMPLLADLPLVLFGDAAAAKSYMALWLAGTLALRDIPVLYLDWEFSAEEHRKRLERLFHPAPNHTKFRYKRCERPLIRIVDGVMADIRKWGIRYVVCDSIGFAVEGSPLDPEAATRYFAAVRRFNCGSLHLAHIAKHQEEGRDATIFGSAFFKAGARSAWYIEKTTENPSDQLKVGLYHRKFNGGKQAVAPLGYQFTFDRTRTYVQPFDVETVDELAANLPMLDRIRRELADGPSTVKRLAETLASTAPIVRTTLARHKSLFVRVGDKVQLAVDTTQEMSF